MADAVPENAALSVASTEFRQRAGGVCYGKPAPSNS